MAVRVYEMGSPSHGLPIRKAPFLGYKELTIPTTAASTGFNRSTTMVTLVASAACSVNIGATPTSTGVMFPLAADTPYDFEVNPTHAIWVSTTT